MKGKRNVWAVFLGIAVAAMSAAGCGAGESSGQGPEKVSEEKRLTVYTSHKQEVYAPIIKEFEERTGIWVEVVPGGTTELLERILAGAGKRNPQGCRSDFRIGCLAGCRFGCDYRRFPGTSSGAAAKMAEQEGVDIRKYSVIYDAIEEVKAAMEGMLAPTLKEQITATIEVREVFNITKVGLVAGAMVKTGKVKRSDKARLIRDGIVIFTGAINALKRFKDDVKEVGTNFECGISLTNCNDIKVGDIIESYEEIEVKQTL